MVSQIFGAESQPFGSGGAQLLPLVPDTHVCLDCPTTSPQRRESKIKDSEFYFTADFFCVCVVPRTIQFMRVHINTYITPPGLSGPPPPFFEPAKGEKPKMDIDKRLRLDETR